jgi:hypothetical protein
MKYAPRKIGFPKLCIWLRFPSRLDSAGFQLLRDPNNWPRRGPSCYPKDIAKHNGGEKEDFAKYEQPGRPALTPYRLPSVSFHDSFPLSHVGVRLKLPET